jgi:hypothetical protein
MQTERTVAGVIQNMDYFKFYPTTANKDISPEGDKKSIARTDVYNGLSGSRKTKIDALIGERDKIGKLLEFKEKEIDRELKRLNVEKNAGKRLLYSSFDPED